MSRYRYVPLDPTGNITCLVLDAPAPGEEKRLTQALLEECEQVAYLEAPEKPGTAARIRLMGGEFCGNAAMAAAAWFVRNDCAEGGEKRLLLSVSGTEAPVPCRVRRHGDRWEGTVRMPGTIRVSRKTFYGRELISVRLEGIHHLILEGETLPDAEAESLLRGIAAETGEEAVGLLQWNREAGTMRPLVWVRDSASLVWEHGCGSGSAAVGAAEAVLRKRPETAVRNPGGVIRAEAETEDGRLKAVSITGQVRLGAERTIEIP